MLARMGRTGLICDRRRVVVSEEVGYARVGGKEAEGAHHVLGRVRERGGPEQFVYFVVNFRQNVQKRQQGLMVVQRKWLLAFLGRGLASK